MINETKQEILDILNTYNKEFQRISSESLKFIINRVSGLIDSNEDLKSIPITSEEKIFGMILVVLCDMPGRFVISFAPDNEMQSCIAFYFEHTMKAFLAMKSILDKEK